MNDFLVQHHRKFVGVGLVVAAGVALSCGGCFGDGTTSLAGQVTSGGKPVTWGTVTVVASDNRVYSAPVRPDGTYEVSGVPRGPVRIAVNSPNPQSAFGPAPAPPASSSAPPDKPATKGGPSPPPPRGAGGGPSGGGGGAAGKPKTQSLAMEATTPPPPVTVPAYVPKQWAPIPGRYANPNTSGLGAEAGRGPTRIDLKVD